MLAHALTQCQARGVTGSLHIRGNPGGLFRLRKGAVVAVDSPGAPGAEVLLLRSGRVSEEDWTAARSHQEDLAARGGVGPAELQVIAMVAAQDGTFAIAAGEVEDHVVDYAPPVDVLLPVTPGVDPERLLLEATRRLNALAAMPSVVSPFRERVVPATAFDSPASGVTAERREILANATGRRSARDIAFAIGRSVYPVTIEISRMLAEGLLEIAPRTTPIEYAATNIKSLRPRRELPPDPGPRQDFPDVLPRRPPPADIPETHGRSRPAGWQALSRLFNRIRGDPYDEWPGAE